MKFSFDESINIKDATVTDLIGALSEIDELESIVENIDLSEEQKNLANKLKKLKKSVVRLAFYYEKNLCKIMI